jgi:hypothetical protein
MFRNLKPYNGLSFPFGNQDTTLLSCPLKSSSGSIAEPAVHFNIFVMTVKFKNIFYLPDLKGENIHITIGIKPDETRMYLNTKTQYYNNHLHVGSIIPLKSIII